MGFQSNLLTGLAEHLAAGGVALWSPTGAYAPTDVGIVLGTVPSTPDSTLTLTGYGVFDDPSLSDGVTGVQVITRSGGADPRSTDDLADAVFGLLHGATALTLPTGVRITQCLRRSHVSLGQDGNRRWSRSDNYYVSAHRPSQHRT